MKVIIVGGGIGGLCTYLSLRKYLPQDTDITVYESYPSAATVGGGLGLAPNGLRAVSKLSAGASERISSIGVHAPYFTFRNSVGTLLGRYTRGRKERYGFDQVMLARSAVHESLLQDVPSEVIKWGQRTREVREVEGGVEVVFEDGHVERADLVIGADGVHSVVRRAVVDSECEALYDGFTGIGGFLPVSLLPESLQNSLTDDPITVTFGSQGSFGYALSSSTRDSLMWWSTYEVATPPDRHAPLEPFHAQLLERHAHWKSPHDAPGSSRVFDSIIALGCGDSAGATPDDRGMLVLPRYITPRLPRWCTPSGRIVLMGDAAHAVPPDAGQGVSCAAEDALALGLLLEHYLADPGALEKTARAYESVRMARLEHILDVAKRRGGNRRRKTWLQEYIRDWMMWIVCKLPESINDSFFAYDVEKEVEKYITTPNRL